MKFVLASLVGLLWASPAHASQKEIQAEAVRLVQQMDKLAAKGAWTGVERAYEQLVSLKVPVAVQIHLMAAQAAQSRGDQTEAWRRFLRVLAVDGLHAEAHLQLATIQATYGEVTLTVHKKWSEPVTLEAKDLGFDPEHFSALEKASSSLEEERTYHGLLPLGRYTLGPVAFEVIGGPPVAVLLK